MEANAMSWLAHPLTYYALLALGLAGCLHLFLSVKREMTSLKKSALQDRRQAEAALAQARRRMEEIQALLEGLEETAQQAATPGPPLTAMNLNRRAQALRMYRRGQSADQIASVLRLPHNEVELLLKLHTAVAGAPQPAPAAERAEHSL